MKKIILFLAFIMLFSCKNEDMGDQINSEEAFKPDESKKITICHKEKETISISVNALQAHLDHGDKIGPCGYTYIPDDNFEAALSDYDDIKGDNLVPTANIIGETFLRIDNSSISDLTGIEDFLSLESLYCEGNLLVEFDISQNTALKHLECYDNQLTNLDVTKNLSLEYLACRNNPLKEIDLSQNKELKYLYCQNIQLTELDLSHNIELWYLYCQNNQLTELDLSQNKDLGYLYVYNNQLTELDLSQNKDLVHLRSYNNQLAELDVSQNTSLWYLFCYNNRLTELDISQNNELRSLYCMNNLLTCIQKGANPLSSLANVNTGGVSILADCGY